MNNNEVKELLLGMSDEFISSMEAFSVMKLDDTVTGKATKVKKAIYEPVKMLADEIKKITDIYATSINSLINTSFDKNLVSKTLTNVSGKVLEAPVVNQELEKKADKDGSYPELAAKIISVPATKELNLQPFNTVMHIAGKTTGYPSNTSSYGLSFRIGLYGMNIILYIPSMADDHNIYYRMMVGETEYPWRKINSNVLS